MESDYHDRWPTTKTVGVPCYGCGKLPTCTIHPDLSACKCWRDGGAIHRRTPENGRDWKSQCRIQSKPEPPKLTEERVRILITDRCAKIFT